MCGITGVYIYKGKGEQYRSSLQKALQCLTPRGPDDRQTFFHQRIGLGHTRLSIIDPSSAGRQPMTDPSGRYTIVYNGELYNYQTLRKELRNRGLEFRSQTDTEVLLNLYKTEGKSCLKRLNGCFAFTIYDQQTKDVFIARDRMGIKPLYYFQDDKKVFFSSDLKALLQYPISRAIDTTALFQYLQLTYIPAPQTILKKVHKLPAGHYITIKNNKFQLATYYQLKHQKRASNIPQSYHQQKEKLAELLDDAVQRRLIADVPVGTFLSGGIDSSIITSLAAQHKKHLNTFTIGFSDAPQYDESHYANLVAEKWQTNHTVFSLKTDDLYQNLYHVLDHLDEPFADSSALAVYILSKKVRQHVKVALSGDGGDELFAGYNKHKAAHLAFQNNWKARLITVLSPLWQHLPQSRHQWLGNKVRQLHRFAQGNKLSAPERYWYWCSFADERAARNLLGANFDINEYQKRKRAILNPISNTRNLNDYLLTDLKLVLQNDMLKKVDSMSMANSLEVRVPLLDHRIVQYALQLPLSSKINMHQQKRILLDTFRHLIPPALYKRPKQGFEVPLLNWFRTSLYSKINKDWLHPDFIEEQEIFNKTTTESYKKRLFSKNPGDVHFDIWKIIVFQHWYKKFISGS